MFLQLTLAMSEDGGLSFTEAITPYLAPLGVVAGIIVTGLFGIWNRRRGATEVRAPDVNESWLRANDLESTLDKERKLRRLLQDLLHSAVIVFQMYALRVRDGGSTDFNTKEQQLFDTKVPDIGDKT